MYQKFKKMEVEMIEEIYFAPIKDGKISLHEFSMLGENGLRLKFPEVAEKIFCNVESYIITPVDNGFIISGCMIINTNEEIQCFFNHNSNYFKSGIWIEYGGYNTESKWRNLFPYPTNGSGKSMIGFTDDIENAIDMALRLKKDLLWIEVVIVDENDNIKKLYTFCIEN